MLKTWKYALFFLLCLIIALLFNLPIQNVLSYVKLPDIVRVSGVDGTLLKGKAREVAIDNFPLWGVNYRYQPSCIHLLKVCYYIDYDRGELQAAYDLLNGDTEVTQALIHYQAAELASRLPDLPVQLTGRLELQVEDLSLINGKPQILNGRLIWHDLGLDEQGVKLDLGDYQLDFTGDTNRYDFKINDLDASLEVDGDGQVKPTGEYEIDIKITSRSGIDPQIKYVLDIVAKKSGHNKYRAEQTGRLPPHIVRQLF